MPKNWYALKASADSDVAEVSILDYIGAYGVDARSFLTELKGVAASTIRFVINSPGGSIVDGIAMFNGVQALKAAGKSIEVKVLGLAASMASYFAMVGGKVVMPSNTFMFLHNPLTGTYGNAEEHRSQAEMLDKMQKTLEAGYASRFKGTEEELRALLAAETLLSAEECLALGLCDEVVDAINVEASFEVDRLPEAARKVFEASKPAPVVAAGTVTVTEIQALATEAGLAEFAPAFAVDAKLITRDALVARIAEAKEIKALADFVGRVDLTDGLVRGGKTLAEARVDLADAIAKAAPNIDTSKPSKSLQPTATTAPFSPTALWAQIEAMKAGSSK